MPVQDIVTIDEYKDVQGIVNSDQDTQLGVYCESVSQLVKTYCNNKFVDHFKTDTNNGYAAKVETFNITYSQHFIQLSETPVVVVSGSKPITVKERTGIGDSYATLVQNTDYYVDTALDTVYRSDGGSGYTNFPLGPGAVEITYFAGYDTAPEDLKLAVIDLITYYFKDQSKGRQTLGGATIANAGSTNLRNSAEFPDHIKRVLDLYKNY